MHVLEYLFWFVWCIFMRVILISICQWDTNLGVLGKKVVWLRNCLHCVSLWACLGEIFLIARRCRRPTVSSATPGSWSWVQKESWLVKKKQTREQLCSAGSVSSCCLEFLSWFPSVVDLLPGSISWNKPFSPQDAFGHDVYHNRELARTVTEKNQV